MRSSWTAASPCWIWRGDRTSRRLSSPRASWICAIARRPNVDPVAGLARSVYFAHRRSTIMAGDPFVIAAREALDDALGDVRASIEGASAEALNWRPAGHETNSIAVLGV